MPAPPATTNHPSLVWFRNDLRVADNTALWNAAHSGRVVGLFTITPTQWQEHDMAQVKVDFIRRNLIELSKQLAKLNIPLMVRLCSDYQDAARKVAEVAQSIDAKQVFWNREYLIHEISRDKQCSGLLSEAQIASTSFEDSPIVPPGQVISGAGEMYKVFTPFFRNWHEQVSSFPADLLPTPASQTKSSLESDAINPLFEQIDCQDSSHWPAGESSALMQLNSFALQDGAREYKLNRDLPSVEGTSKLSPYLSIGALSARQCLAEASRVSGAGEWIRQLAWRDFYYHLTQIHPKIVRGKPFQAKTEKIQWRQSDQDLLAWTEGNTGQPFVDAGMRQLKQKGWMHNRLRMVTAMFLTKNLFLDWRLGERHFMQHLIDGDFALNNGGWQWSASTGTDAVPYFRVFNPFSQSKRFDPEGIFIKEYVPELAEIPASALHDPTKLDAQRPESYPRLIVDIKASRKEAIRAFSELSA
jgi:deoxyribodipyrimidine photo-lyase